EAAKPWIAARAEAAVMFAATSARQHVLSSAASSWVKGGTRRVLTVPAIDALAMIATAHNSPGMPAPPDRPRRTSGAAEPVVTVIFPEAARIIIRDRQCNDEFRVLEAKLCRNPDLDRITELARQYLVGEGESHNRLWVQHRRHVDAGVITIGADETDILLGEIRADALKEDPQRAA